MLVAVVVVTLAACVAPARTRSDYESAAGSTADVVLGSVRTASLIINVAREGNGFWPYAAVTLSDAEGAAASASGTFLAIQPPDGASDAVRAHLSHVLDEADDVLSLARIAARRERLTDLVTLAPRLSELGATLERIVERYE
jgi:hypothetical protein